MKNLIKPITILLSFILFGLLLLPGTLTAQRDFNMQVVLDQPVSRNSPLVLFPGVRDKDSYWYAPKTPKIALDANGRPQFSFIKWVYNQDDGSDEGLGGGILHVVANYKATEEEFQEAERELRKINPRGKIIGPVIFREGTVNISVPKINDPEESEIVAVGPAPIVEGGNFAANLQLDKRSATLLWESFNTPNPAVVISFQMTLAGYNSPLEAKITVHRDQIYNDRRIQAGLATPWASGEIGDFLTEMTDNGSIEIEKIGENFEMQKAIDKAIELAMQEFFTPLGSSQGPNLAQLTAVAGGGNTSFLDRATKLLNDSRKEARTENERIRKTNQANQARVDAANQQIRNENRAERDRVAKENQQIRTENKAERERAAKENEKIREQNANARATATGNAATAGNRDTSAGNAGDKPKAENNAGKPDFSRRDPDADQPGDEGLSPDDEAGQVIRVPEVQPQLTAERSNPDQREEIDDPELVEEETVPFLAVTAAYVVKKIVMKGDRVITFKESYPTTLPYLISGGFGVSRRDCNACFLEVNLDDPVFRQRNVLAVLDGTNATDFDQFINYGSLQLKKKHEGGDYTYDEVRITRQNFAGEGNLFNMVYGWKNDNNRDQWLDYEYKIAWSFFGGHQLETDWQPSNLNTINLTPPLQRKLITVEADRILLEENNVRAIDVKLFYRLGEAGEKEQVKQFTINPSKDILNGQVEIMLPIGELTYDYEVTWRLWGGQERSSGRRTTSFEVLQVDEVN